MPYKQVYTYICIELNKYTHVLLDMLRDNSHPTHILPDILHICHVWRVSLSNFTSVYTDILESKHILNPS